MRAVQVGGPLGAYFPPALFDTPFDYEAFTARDGLLGHGGIVVFDDSVDMARQARFAMEFCATESCGKCTPCRIGAVRGVEVMDRILAGDRVEFHLGLLDDLCNTMKFGSLCALGGFTPISGDERAQAFPRGFRRALGAGWQRVAPRAARGGRVGGHPMTLLQEPDYGTPASKAAAMVTLAIDGNAVTVPEGTSVMRAAMEAGIKVPKLCATDSMAAFGSCRLCLVEIEGRAGTPASCTTPVAAGMKVATHSDRLRRLRRGVMELYLSDHPLDCLTAAAIGNSELLDTAAEIGLRERALRPGGRQSSRCAGRCVEPLFPVRPSALHRLLALRARLRGGAGHVRADRRGPRLRLGDRRRHERAVPDLGMRLLRRLRAGLSDRAR